MSGENDLQSTLSMRLDGTLQPLDAMASKTTIVDKAVAKLHRTSRDYQQDAGKPFKLAGEHANRSGKDVQEFGHALARLRGPLGELAHRSTSGAGMEGTLGRVAVAAGLLGIAYGALNKVAEVRAERVRAAIDAEDRLAKAMESGAASARAHGLAGLGQDGVIRGVVGAGGREAKRVAQTAAQEYGIGEDEAYRGVGATYSRKVQSPTERSRIVSAAGEFAKAGGSFEEGVRSILESPALLSRIRTPNYASDAISDVGSRLYQKHVTGSEIGASTDNLRYAQAQIASDPYLAKATEATRLKNQTADADRKQVINGEATAALRLALTEAVSPLAVELGKLGRERALQTEALTRLADSQGPLLRLIANLGMLIGGNGSSRNQLERFQGATGTGD